MEVFSEGTAVWGIRHHGPGSARALLDALRRFEPDCLLVEAPEEAGAPLLQLLHPDLVLPVALLVYNPKDFSRAVYLPFAEFSPELQAVRFAIQRGLPVVAMDLPIAVQLAMEPDNRPGVQARMEFSEAEARQAVSDPMQFLAGLAGYTDSERWWEATFEQMDNPAEIFRWVAELMQALREELPRQESDETLLREAWMRQRIREAQKAGYRKIAVVCGAWHVPALSDLSKFPEKADKSLLRGLKKEKVKTAWIPWSYDRLAFHSGYGAGVLSPAWYELLFRHRERLTAHWMVRAARLFRQERWDTSPAHAQEAVRLAETLAALRGRSVPGLEELEEAALSVLCQGAEEALGLIRERLVIGMKVGKVPAEFAVTPLQQDFEQCVKAARLVRELQTPGKLTKNLDLRIPANLRASQLLHRLQLLGIPWGTPAELRGEPQGSFREAWKLQWKADYAIRLIQAGLWGNTIETAAAEKAVRDGAALESLPPLLQLLQQTLNAALPQAQAPLTERLRRLSAQTGDMFLLLQTLPPLAQLIRYGNVRKTGRQLLEELLAEIFPRICIGLPASVRGLGEEPAQEWFSLILSVHHAVHLLYTSQEDLAPWHQALRQVGLEDGNPPLLAGMATRILLDKGLWPEALALAALQAQLSFAPNALQCAFWLEGFLHGSAQLLLYTPRLWMILDHWVCEVPDSDFKAMLPVLRRTFSRFSKAERRLLRDQALLGRETQGIALDETRIQEVMPVLALLLGLQENNS